MGTATKGNRGTGARRNNEVRRARIRIIVRSRADKTTEPRDESEARLKAAWIRSVESGGGSVTSFLLKS